MSTVLDNRMNAMHCTPAVKCLPYPAKKGESSQSDALPASRSARSSHPFLPPCDHQSLGAIQIRHIHTIHLPKLHSSRVHGRSWWGGH
mmetsp:Transcript_32542/g.80538  ORF Transcript_32542/g.80538 Transcript_32542/m.80538 type:complete len:88 (-) Transcript_32542:117-380(-)